MDKINYEDYSLNELIDVHNNIDADAYPNRAAEVARQIALKRADQVPEGWFEGDDIQRDSVAKNTAWVPLERAGANFRTHCLVRVRRQRMAFKVSFWGYLFACLFIVIAIVATFNSAISFFENGGFNQSLSAYLEPAIAAAILCVGFAFFYKMSIPRVFDRRRGLYWMSRKAPSRHWSTQKPDSAIRLQDIRALQLLKEYFQTKHSGYYSYELNLVLQSGQRLNVIDHGDLDKLQSDAAKLAEFLGVPVWDATGY